MAGRECYVTITCPRDSYEKMLLIIKHHNFGIAHFNNLESVKYDFLIFLIVILLKKIQGRKCNEKGPHRCPGSSEEGPPA